MVAAYLQAGNATRSPPPPPPPSVRRPCPATPLHPRPAAASQARQPQRAGQTRLQAAVEGWGRGHARMGQPWSGGGRSRAHHRCPRAGTHQAASPCPAPPPALLASQAHAWQPCTTPGAAMVAAMPGQQRGGLPVTAARAPPPRPHRSLAPAPTSHPTPSHLPHALQGTRAAGLNPPLWLHCWGGGAGTFLGTAPPTPHPAGPPPPALTNPHHPAPTCPPNLTGHPPTPA